MSALARRSSWRRLALVTLIVAWIGAGASAQGGAKHPPSHLLEVADGAEQDDRLDPPNGHAVLGLMSAPGMRFLPADREGGTREAPPARGPLQALLCVYRL